MLILHLLLLCFVDAAALVVVFVDSEVFSFVVVLNDVLGIVWVVCFSGVLDVVMVTMLMVTMMTTLSRLL